MSLTPCRFFAAGNCRYGNNCRFYHAPANPSQHGGGMFFGNRTLAPATFSPQNQNAINLSAAKTNQNLDIIVDQVKKDMQEWQMCKMWPYSCYGPVGGKVCLPGFEDLSPEELRLIFMQFGNNLPPEIPQRLQQFSQLRINYLHSTLENRNIIEQVVKAEVPLTPNQAPFGTVTAQSQPQQGNIFGAPPNQQAGNIFGGGLSTQTQPQASSIFGKSAFGGGTQSVFGQPAAGNVFQPQAPQPVLGTPGVGIFGAQPPQNQPGFPATAISSQSGIFQQPQTQPQTSLFQQPQQSAFLQQPPQPAQFQANVFQQPQQQPPTVAIAPSQPSFFQPQAQQPPTGLFQQPQQTPQPTGAPPPYGANQQQSTGFAPPSGNIFGGSVPPQQPPVANIFGGTVGPAFANNPPTMQQPGAIVAPQMTSVVSTQKFVYTDEAELSPEDLEAFKANEFTVDTIPLKPPPHSLCL